MTKFFFLFAAGVFALTAVSIWAFTVDDTYITLKVSRNVAELNGPVYNVGSREEAYTSPLWMLLNVPLHEPLSAKLMGVLFTLGTAVVLYLYSPKRAFGVATAAIFLIYPHTAVHAVSGMETALAAFLVALALYCRSRGWGTRMLAVLTAMVLTRPELVLLAIPLAIETVVRSGDKGRMVPTVWVMFALPLIVWFGMRMIYYETLMPLSFYVKSGEAAANGWPMVLDFLRDNAVILVPLGAILVYWLKMQRYAAVGVALVLVYLVVPMHTMGYGYRFFFPLIPALLMFSESFSYAFFQKHVAVPAMLLLTIIYTGLGIRSIDTYREQGERLQATHRQLAESLTGEGTIVCGDIGMIGYYGSWKVVDFIGLADRTVALGYGTPEYFLSRDPDLIVGIIHNGVTLRPDIIEYAEKEAGYKRIGALQYAANYYLLILAKPDSPNAERALTNLLGDRYKRETSS